MSTQHQIRPHPELKLLHDAISQRAAATLAAQPDFPCRKGCDHCCRHLASLPLLTEPEWQLLRQGLSELPANTRAAIQERLQALGPTPQRPITCPLLDPGTGACLVYAHRPTACRTYGFYVERGQGLYCPTIQSAADAGELNHITWGNQATIEHRLNALGPTRTLAEWLAATLPVE